MRDQSKDKLEIPEEINQYIVKNPDFFARGENRIVLTKGYNFVMNMQTGGFVRWGVTPQDNPKFSPLGPELLDWEISTICSGINGKNCSFCYKSNTTHGTNVSLDQFKRLFLKIPTNVSQIAFGIGDLHGNPDLFKIMEYCRNNPYHKVIPNLTFNGTGYTQSDLQQLSKLCGSVAISNYNLDICATAVHELSKYDIQQINIHQMVAQETYDDTLKLIEAIRVDPRFHGVYAVVFLALKQKGRGIGYHPLSADQFGKLANKVIDSGKNLGFDSCSAYKVIQAYKDHPNFTNIEMSIESCESSLFSAYINVQGEIFPCSFIEGIPGWENGIPLDDTKDFGEDFLEDIWYHPKLKGFREKLLKTATNPYNCRTCPYYNI